jgi:hypothetical protein
LASGIWENPEPAGRRRGAHGETRPTHGGWVIAAGGPVEACSASITGRVWHSGGKGVSSTRRVFADLCSSRRVSSRFFCVGFEQKVKRGKKRDTNCTNFREWNTDKQIPERKIMKETKLKTGGGSTPNPKDIDRCKYDNLIN